MTKVMGINIRVVYRAVFNVVTILSAGFLFTIASQFVLSAPITTAASLNSNQHIKRAVTVSSSAQAETVSLTSTSVFSTYLPFVSRGTGAPTEGLRGFWTLDETTGQRLDGSGHSYHLSDNNTVGSVSGKLNTAADFERDNSHYLSISGTNKSLGIANSFTLAGWMKAESLDQMSIMASQYEWDVTNRRYRFGVNDSNKLHFVASPDGQYLTDYILEGNSSLISARWYHVAAVFDAANQTMTLYLDGKPDGTRSVTFNALFSSTAPFILGANMQNGAVVQHFDGVLDEWYVYDRALSQSEIQALIDLIPTPTPTPTACNPTNGSGGLTPGHYQTTVAGLNATLVVGTGYNPQTPTYLGFLLHGDGGLFGIFDSPSNPVVQMVNDRGWILVAPVSPNGGEAWWKNWNGDHIQAFAAVLDEMFANYNLCRDTVFGSSSSGGSEFWTSYFFPERGGTYPAHTVIACGGNDGTGSVSQQKVMALGQDPNVVAKSTFDYVYGNNDNLYNLIQQSITLYTNSGFNVQVQEIAGAGHCNTWITQGFPSLSQHIVTHWTDRAAALGIP